MECQELPVVADSKTEAGVGFLDVEVAFFVHDLGPVKELHDIFQFFRK